jgi:hypothetical protein
MKSFSKRTIVTTLLIASTMAMTQAHELPSNRLSIVLRDNTHLTLTYLIDYAQALHLALEPQRSMTEFSVIYSAMPPAEFQKVLLRAQGKFSSTTKITMPNGEQIAVSNWRWPDAAKVQAQLQQRVMQSVVAANDHRHEVAIEIQAEASANSKISALTLSLPESFGAVTVVSYKPTQTVVKPRSAAIPIKF